MPLTVDTGPRIYLEIDNHSDTEMHAHFTWSTMDMEQFLIKNESSDTVILKNGKETFTFDHNCNHIMLSILQADLEVFQAKLESYTVSRTYTISGANGVYECTSHEN
ncbi:MAG: hypothetical protein KH431_07440 [Erysipelotrichaceae bacterium]|uniref:Uncharacterized protein n=1 Tax=Copranaerobaculum intestinale TaxID=2692629 RepID=A0A6N8U570_9FIRM|nr:hypothetical protein [Copranaerobaculum intestinale]MBS6374422.1 hypothetical protein [Erysipelotrichaceae bacterium]MXQ72464.1 hypothetical protein [Copranaerobaculum intestinale]